MTLRRIRSTAQISLAVLIGFCAPATSGQIINTIAGGGTDDGRAATLASLSGPRGMVFDRLGNLFIADTQNHRIRKVDTLGIISTVAGNGSQSFGGDGGPAVNAGLNYPEGLAIDSAGNLYIADSQNNRIRKVTPSGFISTVAGNQLVFGSDGGPATSAMLAGPKGVALDTNGNLYISENGGNRIRKVNTSGVISTVAGTGLSGFGGDGGAATSARLTSPLGIAIDNAGNLYIAEYGNHCIRKVSANGIISTVAGIRSTYSESGSIGDGGAATSAILNNPASVTLDGAGNLYVADTGNRRIRKVSTGGIITTVVGAGPGGDGGPATQASLWAPSGVALDGAGNLHIADADNNRIRKVNTTGIISTVAGDEKFGFVGDSRAATNASLQSPAHLALDGAGNLYIAEAARHRVRKVDNSGVISTVAGNGSAGLVGDGGPAISARLNSPLSVAVDSIGNLYIADFGNSRIRKVNADGIISTVAGDGNIAFSGDGGPATRASFCWPKGVAVDATGNLYVAETCSHRIRKVNTSGIISTVAGHGFRDSISGDGGFSGDGGVATSAGLNRPLSVTVDSGGSLYILDSGNARIRKVNPNGIISTVAGNGTFGFSGDGGAATSASLAQPAGMATDNAGNLYIADTYNHRIRKVNASGIISSVVGNGIAGFRGDGGAAPDASLNLPQGPVLDVAGNLYIADFGNQRIRKVSLGDQSFNYQGAWWAGSTENGWGLSLIQHGSVLAAGWYYFNSQGQATWAIVPGCTWNGSNTACTGNVTTSTGSWLGSYTGIQSQSVIGTATFNFTGPTAGTMSWNIGGVLGTKAISKLNYASGTSPSGIDYTDIWWGGVAQNGWGVALLQQGGVLAGAWYTYNQQNQPVWYLINGGTWTSSTVFSAPLTRATGSPLIGATYNPGLLNTVTAGTVTISFTNESSATMTYTVDGVTQTKSIARFAF